ncbi:hypothetical protein V7X04_19435 [Bacillus safensis]|uniref:hypothetical protein n=1 Tax=Bacillus safensis TaxID=561879 RepID=UPI002FFE615E
MRLQIEKWLDQQNFKEDINSLFEESITCYKASAYRASFLFSFLAFQSVIKERILKAEMPKNHNLHTWNGLKKNLRNEDKWDLEVIESIKINNEGKRIFNITQDLRDQALYWKGRRNDCAHSKPNTISYSHVESFWLFLISNLPKFFVDGGVKALLQNIDKHFNPNFTNNNEDFTHIINEVPFMVNEDEMDYFLEQLEIIFYNHDTNYMFVISERMLSFYNSLIKLESFISTKTIDFIKNKRRGLEAIYLENYPNHIDLFYNEEKSLRNFWRTKLPTMGGSKFVILAYLLRNDLLKKDKEEAIEYFINNISAVPNTFPVALIPDLQFHGYFEKYKKMVFFDGLLSDFHWANTEGRFTITEHLNVIGLNEEIVESINRTFSNGNHPFKMRDTLRGYFTDASKKSEYIDVCRSLDITPVDNLGF